MNFFKVTYHGLWLGGVAIVCAYDAEQAIELVRQHKDTDDFSNVECVPIPVPGPMVLYNDNGDY